MRPNELIKLLDKESKEYFFIANTVPHNDDEEFMWARAIGMLLKRCGEHLQRIQIEYGQACDRRDYDIEECDVLNED